MRRARRNSPLALISLLAALLGPAITHAESTLTAREVRTAEHKKAAELAVQKAAAARAANAAVEEAQLAQARIAAAAVLRNAEAATEQAASRMDALAARRRDAEARLAKRAAAMQPLLPLIERLSLYPAETMLAVPDTVENRLRGILVLRGLARQLEIEAKALRQDQAEADAATAAITAETPKLTADLADQAAHAADLDRMIADAQARRAQAETAADSAAQRAAAAAAQADSLRAALVALETERKAEAERAHAEALRADKQKHADEAAAARDREAALARPAASLGGGLGKSRLAMPVVGKLIRSFGDRTEAGPATGLSFQAPPNARVIAPCTGKVAFADKFRSYGQLLILDCGGGYHAVLSGLERLDAKAGQSVQSGEPLGTMPNWEPGGAGRRPALYIELRHDGQPIDPAPWLRGTG